MPTRNILIGLQTNGNSNEHSRGAFWQVSPVCVLNLQPSMPLFWPLDMPVCVAQTALQQRLLPSSLAGHRRQKLASQRCSRGHAHGDQAGEGVASAPQQRVRPSSPRPHQQAPRLGLKFLNQPPETRRGQMFVDMNVRSRSRSVLCGDVQISEFKEIPLGILKQLFLEFTLWDLYCVCV